VHEGFHDDFMSVLDQVMADFASAYAQFPDFRFVIMAMHASL
jgi:hypothetical protein